MGVAARSDHAGPRRAPGPPYPGDRRPAARIPEPHARPHGIAIRHRDGYRFGENRLRGDVFPHCWSVLTATTLLRLPATLRTADTDRLAEAILRADMASHHEDTSATCAFVMPSTVGGRAAHDADPLANDQDRHLVLWLRHHDARATGRGRTFGDGRDVPRERHLAASTPVRGSAPNRHRPREAPVRRRRHPLLLLGHLTEEGVASEALGTSRKTLGPDAAGRLASSTTGDGGTTRSTTSTTVNHHSCGCDTTSWTVTTDAAGSATTVKRTASDLSGGLAVTTSADGDAVLTLGLLDSGTQRLGTDVELAGDFGHRPS